MLPTAIPNRGLLYLPLESEGTPEANPTLVVEATIVDAITHQPVTADVYVVNAAEYREPIPDELVLRTTEHFEIQFPSQSDHWFLVRAPGYEDWKLHLSYRLRSSRKLSGPIKVNK